MATRSQESAEIKILSSVFDDTDHGACYLRRGLNMRTAVCEERIRVELHNSGFYTFDYSGLVAAPS